MGLCLKKLKKHKSILIIFFSIFTVHIAQAFYTLFPIDFLFDISIIELYLFFVFKSLFIEKRDRKLLEKGYGREIS
jgi:hypothetical protein